MTIIACLAALLLVASPPEAASAAETKLLCAIGLRPVMNQLIPQFEKAENHTVSAVYKTAGALAAAIEKGEAADVAILTSPQLEKLEKEGQVAASSRVEFAKLGIGVFTRKGAAKPGIGSAEAFEKALLNVRSIGHAEPTAGGAIASYVAAMLSRLPIAADIKPKLRTFPPSVYDTVANGDIELGFGSISEIMADPRLELVGPLPAELQHYTRFAAGLLASSKERHAGTALIHFISSPASVAVLKERGYEPP